MLEYPFIDIYYILTTRIHIYIYDASHVKVYRYNRSDIATHVSLIYVCYTVVIMSLVIILILMGLLLFSYITFVIFINIYISVYRYSRFDAYITCLHGQQQLYGRATIRDGFIHVVAPCCFDRIH